MQRLQTSLSAETEPSPAIEKVSPGVFRLGTVTINKHERSITFPAQINMDKGLLEYLLVRGSGKTHESLLRTEVEPYHLQIAFLLLGFEPTSGPLAFQGAAEKPQGKPVEILVRHRDKGGREVELNAHEWIAIKEEETLKPSGKIDWVYTGSIVLEGRFLAQNEGSIIATYHDPVAMIDNASKGGESDMIWFVREESVPPVGTPVTVTVRAIK